MNINKTSNIVSTTSTVAVPSVCARGFMEEFYMKS